MAAFDWDPALETGEERIDDQHRSLFALANALDRAVSDGDTDPEITTDAVYRLTDYVVQHFADEEELMEAAGYPACGVHRSLHQHLTAETLGLAARFMSGGDVSPEMIAAFVADWLRVHIREEDMAFVRFAAERED
jgi:hemerythrin